MFQNFFLLRFSQDGFILRLVESSRRVSGRSVTHVDLQEIGGFILWLQLIGHLL